MALKKVSGCVTFPVAGAVYDRTPQGKTNWKMLTHSWQAELVRTLCRRVKPDSVLDDYALPGQEEPPTCLECLRRDARFA
jgi:hypothetical protein